VDGEAGRPRRQARGPRLRLSAADARAAAALLVVAAALAACAYPGDPPGGPPDTTPPRIVQVVPDSGAVLAAPPHEADIIFDEVINERVTGGQGTIGGAVLLSPTTRETKVGWHRNRISVAPRGGFRAGRIYRLELLPVISDLRQNKIRRGRTIIFSTGPPIPDATLRGTVVDWVANHAAGLALVEAVLLPDSLPYRALADSSGNFTLAQMPPGRYLVYGVVDQNANRLRDPREAYDTSLVTLRDTAAVRLYAFVHDTVAPRVRTVEYTDSVTARITFDHPLDPADVLDTSRVRVWPRDDSTTALPLAGVLTPAAYDSVVRAAAALRDSIRAAQAPAPTPGAQGAGAPPGGAGRAAPPARPRTVADTSRARRDTTEARRMLQVRPAPSDVRIIRFAEPLEPGARYTVSVSRAVSLTGVAGHGRSTLVVPARKPAPARADTTHEARPEPGHAPAADTGRAAPGASPAAAPTPAAPAPRPPHPGAR
jgi:hypothetical protein